jgi:hypothetical protein
MNTWIVRRIKKLVLLSILSGSLFGLSFCADNENFREFRETAGPGVESGLKTIFVEGDDGDAIDTIVDSIIEGLFAIIAPDSNG